MKTAAASDTPQVLLAHHLRKLKLPTFQREYDKVAKEAAKEGLDHPRYLLRLAELELIDRERRMVAPRIRPPHGAAPWGPRQGGKIPGNQVARHL